MIAHSGQLLSKRRNVFALFLQEDVIAPSPVSDESQMTTNGIISTTPQYSLSMRHWNDHLLSSNLDLVEQSFEEATHSLLVPRRTVALNAEFSLKRLDFP